MLSPYKSPPIKEKSSGCCSLSSIDGTYSILDESLNRMTGRCFLLPFFPTVTRWSAKTISAERSKKPRPFCQLMPHLQCLRPINCCLIALPQRGQFLFCFFSFIRIYICAMGYHSTDCEPKLIAGICSIRKVSHFRYHLYSQIAAQPQSGNPKTCICCR